MRSAEGKCDHPGWNTYLRANCLAISVFDTHDDIVARCCDAWNFFANDQERVLSISDREYAKAVNS